MKTRFAYLHGFGSSPRTKKGVVLADAFAARGATLERPDLSVPSFSRLSPLTALAAIDALDAAGEAARWRILGSSMGGYLAARWAELHPEKVEKLVLLCPGFELGTRWPEIVGPAKMEEWKRNGSLPFMNFATGKPENVHYGFFEEGLTLPPRPVVPCPTLIFHGRRDPTVPIEVSRSYAAEHADRVRLVELDDVHELLDSLPFIVEETLRFFDVTSPDRG